MATILGIVRKGDSPEKVQRRLHKKLRNTAFRDARQAMSLTLKEGSIEERLAKYRDTPPTEESERREKEARREIEGMRPVARSVHRAVKKGKTSGPIPNEYISQLMHNTSVVRGVPEMSVVRYGLTSDVYDYVKDLKKKMDVKEAEFGLSKGPLERKGLKERLVNPKAKEAMRKDIENIRRYRREGYTARLPKGRGLPVVLAPLFLADAVRERLMRGKEK